MKAVIGIDIVDNYKRALNLYSRLDFQPRETHLVHCIESVLVDGSFPELGPNHPVTAIMEANAEEGRRALEQAASDVGEEAVKKIVNGNPGPALIKYAEQNQADLVAAGGAHHGALDCFISGSVCRALAIGAKQSVLIAKQKHPKTGPLSVVLATDHSDYANRCIDRLIEFNPLGIGRLTILTASMNKAGIPISLSGLVGGENAAEVLARELNDKNRQVSEKLSGLAERVDTLLVPEDPTQAIRHTMEKTEADLLIMGAQGHGFWDRLTMGSVSLHQVVSESHSVLVLRV
jgi:nucleotide-binding universal stress UspA family protein